ncbi:hypothetical protein D7Y09_03790 [bacterium 1XD42-1]|nr:hypothetical protein D7X25_06695 [bacterium 1XD42-8]RKJ66420.1 hypothetical protein D7Y09_03790 [bacterium 1XD42-1]
MNSVLSDLYEGKIFPAEEYSSKSETYQKLRQKYCRCYEDFIKTLQKLDPPLDTEFIRIMNEHLDMVPFEFSETFIDGFRLGARMMIEVFQNDLHIR